MPFIGGKRRKLECIFMPNYLGYNVLMVYQLFLTIYTVEYYSAIKKNEIMPFATTWIDLESIMLSEISQTEKEKICMLSLICGI